MPVETKVTAATAASTVTGLVVMLLGTMVFHGSTPAAVVSILGAVITGAVTFIVAWLAKHTPRSLVNVVDIGSSATSTAPPAPASWAPPPVDIAPAAPPSTPGGT